MDCKIIVEKITGGLYVTVRDELENPIASAAMTTRDAAIAKAKSRAIAETNKEDRPLTFDVCDLY